MLGVAIAIAVRRVRIILRIVTALSSIIPACDRLNSEGGVDVVLIAKERISRPVVAKDGKPAGRRGQSLSVRLR
jgi:hypothetical protein